MNISKLDIHSETYKQFVGLLNQKVSQMVMWLNDHNIEYIWNYWIGNHLYRLYIPSKDLLLDFEYYPIYNIEYNYIRVNYDTDVILLLENLFPTNVLDTQELEVYKLHQRAANKFLRENGASPVYDKTVLRLGFVKNDVIYQCMILKDNRIIRNVTKQRCTINWGTYILLRYLTELFGYSEITIKSNTENSYINNMLQLIGAKSIEHSNKKKIWWNSNGCKWKINKEQTNQFIPFYFCEDILYEYK